MLRPIEWQVLNETADDWESLEQVYRSLAFEPVPVTGETLSSFLWHARTGAPSLAEIVDALHSLTRKGLLSVRTEAGSVDLEDLSYLWQGWFSMSPEGREVFVNDPDATES